MVKQDHLPRRLWWVLAGLTLVWGLNWPAMKVTLSEVAPWTFRAICLAAGAGVLFAVLRVNRQSLVIARSEWGRLALIAFFTITCWNMLVAFGVQLIPSGRAAILSYTMPVLAIPLSVWVLRERMTVRKLAALALGMGGIALLVGDELQGIGAAPLGIVYTLGAALSWAIGTVLQKKYPIDAPLPALTAWLMLVGGLPVYAGALFFDAGKSLDLSLVPSIGLAYNVFISFAWGYWAWIKLVGAVSVTVFSICMLLTPVVGVFSGMLLLGERPGWMEFGAMALVIASVLCVVLPSREGGNNP